VTCATFHLRTLQLSEEFGYSDFKASKGQCTRFHNSHGLTLRQHTHIAQKLPSDVDDKVTSFQKFIIDL
jgi:hypothetical protein